MDIVERVHSEPRLVLFETGANSVFHFTDEDPHVRWGVLVILFSPFPNDIRLIGGLMIICAGLIMGAIQDAANFMSRRNQE